MELSKFNKKLNRIDNNIYTIEEKITPVDGIYEADLCHDNVELSTINIYTGSKLTGDKVNTYTISTPSLTPWRTNIKIYSTEPVLYITYETTGDTVEGIDINNVQDAINYTQESLNKETDRAVKKEKDIESNLNVEINRAENKESEIASNLNTEINRAEKSENDLHENIDNESARAKSAESTISDNLDSEIERAKEKENTLHENIDSEINRAQSTESTIANNLSSETSRAISEEQDIKSDINANRGNWNDAYSKRHIHKNKAVIDLLEKNDTGELTFEGGKIGNTTVNGLSDEITIAGGNNITVSKEGTKIIVSGNGQQEKIVTNTPISITASDWSLYAGTPNVYKVTVNHNLKDSNIIVSVYNGKQSVELTGVRIIDDNSIELLNYEAIDCKVIINSSGQPTKVIDNLDSAESTKALSAKQGKMLKEMINAVEGGIVVGKTLDTAKKTTLFFEIID